jgi:hypothetical protein
MESLRDFAIVQPKKTATVIGGLLHGMTIDVSKAGCCEFFEENDGTYSFQCYRQYKNGQDLVEVNAYVHDDIPAEWLDRWLANGCQLPVDNPMLPRLIKSQTDSRTITVGKLIQILEKHDSRMPVAYLWEAQVTPVVPSEIKEHEESDLDDVYGPIVLLNAET